MVSLVQLQNRRVVLVSGTKAKGFSSLVIQVVFLVRFLELEDFFRFGPPWSEFEILEWFGTFDVSAQVKERGRKDRGTRVM